MVIKSLKLKNYRNYDLLDLKFDPKTNILYGDNAQGKTNILEALYLSGTTKSHRGTKDRDVIQFGYDESHIETIIEKRNIDFQIGRTGSSFEYFRKPTVLYYKCIGRQWSDPLLWEYRTI